MRINTELTQRFGLSLPVIQAPMAGGGDTAELVAAVSNAGGLGCTGAAYLTPAQIIERGRQVRSLTSRAFGINLFAPLPEQHVEAAQAARARERLRPYYEELGVSVPDAATSTPPLNFADQLAAALETGAQLFSFTFGALPSSTIRDIQQRGLFVAGTATTVNEGQALVETGVDAVIAQGSEAGGHRGTFATEFESGLVGSLALIPQMADELSAPVIASGGIMDGRGVAAALLLGASAVQMGTAFLTCDEAGVAPAYKQAIFEAREDQTRLTRAFSGRPARGIANRLLCDFATADQEEEILPFPHQNGLTRPLRTEAARQNRSDYLSLWAGQGVRLARSGPVAELVAQLGAEISLALQSLEKRISFNDE